MMATRTASRTASEIRSGVSSGAGSSALGSATGNSVVSFMSIGSVMAGLLQVGARQEKGI